MKRRIGFTIVELLVVIAIIGVLLALLLVGIQKTRLSALEIERKNWHHQRKFGETIPRSSPFKILFIGNSFTSTNDLPGMLRALSLSGHASPEIIVERELVGGAKLKTHWDAGTALEKIRSDQWDFVVLQEQSQTPLKHFGRDIYFYPYATKFDKAIRNQGAIPLFYMTWTRPDTPGPQSWWTDSYVTITKKLGAEVSPVGMSWENTKTSIPNINLYTDAGGHPTQEGTYIAACTFYATIYDRSPVGLPHQLQTSQGQVNIDANHAAIIQQAAWDALVEVKPRVIPKWREDAFMD